jgi:hypothetical protein
VCIIQIVGIYMYMRRVLRLCETELYGGDFVDVVASFFSVVGDDVREFHRLYCTNTQTALQMLRVFINLGPALYGRIKKKEGNTLPAIPKPPTVPAFKQAETGILLGPLNPPPSQAQPTSDDKSAIETPSLDGPQPFNQPQCTDEDAGGPVSSSCFAATSSPKASVATTQQPTSNKHTSRTRRRVIPPTPSST